MATLVVLYIPDIPKRDSPTSDKSQDRPITQFFKLWQNYYISLDYSIRAALIDML